MKSFKSLKLDDLDTEGYQKIVNISSVKDTEVITVAVTSKEPQEAATIANEIVRVFQDKIYSIMNIENVTVLNSAKVPEKEIQPFQYQNTLIGFLIGCVIDGCIVVYLLLNDRNIRTEEEMKQIFDYPIIGLIPDMNAGGTE